MKKIFQLVYISHSTQFREAAALQELLNVSRRNNLRDELTGMLLYHNDQFLQVLEGEESVVMQTFERIKQDARHRACRKMAVFYRDTPEFADWSMAYLSLGKNEADELTGFNTFMQSSVDNQAQASSQARQLLQQFKQRTQAMATKKAG